MATLYITEFHNQVVDSNGRPLTGRGQLPAVAEQTVAIGAGSVVSAAFNSQTTFIRVCSDAVCSIVAGAAPTATPNNMRLPANSPDYFAVKAGQKLAVITNT